MSAEVSTISISSRHLVGARVLLPSFFLGLAHGAAMLSLYLLASSALGYGPDIINSFVAVALVAWGLGASCWGRAIDGESSLAPRMLAVTQILAALYGLLWPWLLSFSGWLGAVLYPWAGQEAGLARLAGVCVALLPLLGPPAFLGGGALPLLVEMGLKKRRLLEWNLPLIGGSRLLGLAGGFAVAALAPYAQNHILWAALGANMLVALIIAFLGEKPRRDEYEGEPGASRLWPSRSLGLWSGEAINVLDHDLTKTAARPAWLVTFLAALVISGSLSLWGPHFGFTGVRAVYDANLWWVYVPGAMALGGLLIAPQLSRHGSPSTVLALAGFLTAFGILFAPWLLDSVSPAALGESFWARPEFLAFLWPTAIWGVLWPLAGQVFHSRRHWLASSLGFASFWACLGGAAGLFLTGSGLAFHQASALYAVLAFLAAFLAVTPLVGHFVAIVMWLAASAMLFFIQPDTFRADYLEARAQQAPAAREADIEHSE